MSPSPLISVVVPVHNGAPYLREALESVLAQTYRPIELIVVDDGSDDDTPSVLEALRGHLCSVRQERAGTAVAVNRGIELARGTLLASLDADDLWTPDKLERQMEAIGGRDRTALVFGYVRQFYSPELSERERGAIVCPAEPAPGISRGTMLVWREAFERVGPFSPLWQVGEFLDWYARAVDAGLRTVVIEQVVMHRRLHMTHTTLLAPGERRDYARILAAALRRRRSTRSS